MWSFKREQTKTNLPDLVQEKPGRRKHKAVQALSPAAGSRRQFRPQPLPSPERRPEGAVPLRSLFLGAVVFRGQALPWVFAFTLYPTFSGLKAPPAGSM